MKHLLLTLTLILSSAAFASDFDMPSDFAPVDSGSTLVAPHPAQGGADEMRDVLNCRPAVLHPDLGMALSVSEGGFAGLTQITINRFFLGHHTTENFIVQRQEMDSHIVGAPVVYLGEGVRLAINFTTSPLKDGGQASTLTINGNSEQLSCKVVNRYVNY
jgi:hypothetical protein